MIRWNADAGVEAGRLGDLHRLDTSLCVTLGTTGVGTRMST